MKMFLSMWSVWLLVFVLHCPTLHCFGAHLLSVCNNADSLLRDAPKNCTQKPLCPAHVLNDSKCIQPKPDCVYDDILIYKCKWRGCTDEESLLQEPVLRKKLLVEGRYFCIQKPICDNHTKLHNNTERCIRPKYDCTHEESKEMCSSTSSTFQSSFYYCR
ncbi:unnamed protein product, partial [Mesorhabditis belari]|uniref:Secreted protein n=1 Tax=Mesorhabditis belari TaxID=2138241 RepID=A0AAF3J672_9BILA